MKKMKSVITKKYSPSELAESFVFRNKLSVKEKEEADNSLSALRKKAIASMSEGQILSMELISLKYQMEDYIKSNDYSSENTFGNYIKRYAKIIERKKYELASDLGIDETRFSQIINGHLLPSEKLVYRLEYHCNHLIPGKLWLAVLHKDVEQKTLQDTATRDAEYKNVKKHLNLVGKVGFVSSKKSRVQLSSKSDFTNVIYSDKNKNVAQVREKKTAYGSRVGKRKKK